MKLRLVSILLFSIIPLFSMEQTSSKPRRLLDELQEDYNSFVKMYHQRAEEQKHDHKIESINSRQDFLQFLRKFKKAYEYQYALDVCAVNILQKWEILKKCALVDKKKVNVQVLTAEKIAQYFDPKASRALKDFLFANDSFMSALKAKFEDLEWDEHFQGLLILNHLKNYHLMHQAWYEEKGIMHYSDIKIVINRNVQEYLDRYLGDDTCTIIGDFEKKDSTLKHTKLLTQFKKILVRTTSQAIQAPVEYPYKGHYNRVCTALDEEARLAEFDLITASESSKKTKNKHKNQKNNAVSKRAPAVTETVAEKSDDNSENNNHYVMNFFEEISSEPKKAPVTFKEKTIKETSNYIVVQNKDGIHYVLFKIKPNHDETTMPGFDNRVLESLIATTKTDFDEKGMLNYYRHRAPSITSTMVGLIGGIRWEREHNTENKNDIVLSFPALIILDREYYIKHGFKEPQGIQAITSGKKYVEGFLEAGIAFDKDNIRNSKDSVLKCYHWYITQNTDNAEIKNILLDCVNIWNTEQK